MRKNGYFIRVICVSLMLLAFSAFVQAQQTAQLEPSFDLALQLVVGSNDGARGDVPAELTGVTKQIKRSFGLTNYRLATTFIGRISNRGGFEYKSTSNIFGQNQPGRHKRFLTGRFVICVRCPPETDKPDFRPTRFALVPAFLF
jgi:hypothetical protein